LDLFQLASRVVTEFELRNLLGSGEGTTAGFCC
jgi:hypothetical protein